MMQIILVLGFCTLVTRTSGGFHLNVSLNCRSLFDEVII